MYVKSNKYKNSRLYDIVDHITGEIIAEKLPLYTKYEYTDLLEQNKLKEQEENKRGTKKYSINKTTSFSLMQQMPSKERFKLMAKKFLRQAVINTADVKENAINFDIIDKYIDSLPDSMFEYISSSIGDLEDNGITASTSRKNHISVQMPKLGLIREAEKLSGIKLQGYKYKHHYQFKWRQYGEIIPLESEKVSQN